MASNNALIDSLLSGQSKLAVIGLGYVGQPLAEAFSQLMPVIGFDINQDVIENLLSLVTRHSSLQLTSNQALLAQATVYLIAVPTPVDERKTPNLTALLDATKMVAKYLKKGDYVIYESTVYPGCTEEECVPILEGAVPGGRSQAAMTAPDNFLKYKRDFKVGFSPERINPGDEQHTLINTVKVTSGCDEESAEVIADLYRLIVKAGVHPVSSIKVAETAKIIENTQRDLNIALMNELSIICNKMGVNTYEALEAAGTKWNFLKFSPGLVGGHCIGVDPYYLTYRAQTLGYHAHVITAGRYVNDSMGFYIAKQTVKRLLAKGLDIHKARILVMGFTFKENVADIRNTRVADLVKELQSYQAEVTLTDPHADPKEVRRAYNQTLTNSIVPAHDDARYDALIIAVAHTEYLNYTAQDFKNMIKPDGLLVDVKGLYRGKISGLEYWSL